MTKFKKYLSISMLHQPKVKIFIICTDENLLEVKIKKPTNHSPV